MKVRGRRVNEQRRRRAGRVRGDARRKADKYNANKIMPWWGFSVTHKYSSITDGREDEVQEILQQFV